MTNTSIEVLEGDHNGMSEKIVLSRSCIVRNHGLTMNANKFLLDHGMEDRIQNNEGTTTNTVVVVPLEFVAILWYYCIRLFPCISKL